MMNISADSAWGWRGKRPHTLIIRTTLYDLIAAFNAEVGADEDDFVIARVMHLLNTHRLTYSYASRPRRVGHWSEPSRTVVPQCAHDRMQRAGRGERSQAGALQAIYRREPSALEP
jgi:hypothetical protein